MLIPMKKIVFNSKKKIVNRPSNGTLDETDLTININGNYRENRKLHNVILHT